MNKNPDKLEQKALQYEQKGKTKKALKCREKAAQLRANNGMSILFTNIPTPYRLYPFC